MSSTANLSASDHADRPRTGPVRLAGAAWILSGIVYFVGQAVTIAQWQGGAYSLSLNLISDLGMTGCGPVEDIFLPRYVCSSGHGWFNLSTILAGALLVAGSVALLAAWRGRHSPRGTAAVAWLMLLSGIGLAGVGVAPADVQLTVHTVAALAQAVTTWIAMGLVWWAFRSWRRPHQQGRRPLVTGPSASVTLVLLIVSVVACVILVLPTALTAPGLVERLAFDLLNLWTILVGAHVFALPKAQRRESRRAEEAARRRREAAERDAAVRRVADGDR